jgi:hypothetical protein
VPRPATPISRNGLRRALGKLGDQVTQALLDAGFLFDPNDNACRHAQNENRYTVWQIPYDSAGGAGQGLRPTIQIELTYAALRLPAVTLPVLFNAKPSTGNRFHRQGESCPWFALPDIAGRPQSMCCFA